MQLDYQTAKSLAFTFAPFLISYGVSYYRSIKAASLANAPSVRPVPPHVYRALVLLVVAAAAALLVALPFFGPENVIAATQSRLQTPSDVLWRRVASTLRHDNQLSPADQRLRERMLSLDSRCLYLTFGPDALANCAFCTSTGTDGAAGSSSSSSSSSKPVAYLVYSLPSILLPHILNTLVLGLATSSVVSGKEGSRWRSAAAVAGFALAAADVFALHYYDHKANGRAAVRAEPLTFFYWNMRAARHVGLGVVDAVFAALLYLSSTNRLFATPFTAAERVDASIHELEAAAGKLSALGILRNAQVRSAELQDRQRSYWKDEGEIMAEIMADEHVLAAVRAALSSGRLNMERVERDARAYAEGLMGSTATAAAAATAGIGMRPPTTKTPRHNNNRKKD